MLDPIATAKKLANLRDRAATPGEAQAAAVALAKVMARYEHAPPVCHFVSTPLFSYPRPIPWKIKLSGCLCRHFGAVPYIARDLLRLSKMGQIHICGAPEAIHSTCILFDYVVGEVNRLGRGRGQDWRNGFIDGIAKGLEQRTEAEAELTRIMSWLREGKRTDTIIVRDVTTNAANRANGYNKGVAVNDVLGKRLPQ